MEVRIGGGIRIMSVCWCRGQEVWGRGGWRERGARGGMAGQEEIDL